MNTVAERLAFAFDTGDYSMRDIKEVTALLRQQAAEIEQLKSEMEDQYPCIERLRTAVALKNGVIKTLQDEANDARLEIERANALLRQALDVAERQAEIVGPTAIGTHGLIAAIKTHLKEHHGN